MTHPRQTRVTSRQVARHAGVSQTTVSLVLNNAPNAHISPATRARVLEAARELGYIPDAAARSLARGRSSNIGLVLVRPHEQIFIDEYLPTLLTGLNQLAHRHGYRILVDILDDAGNADAFADLVHGKEVAGFIVQFSNPTQEALDRLTRYAADGFPIVALGHWNADLPTVEVDKIAGVGQATQHLIDLGHRRIGCIPYAPPETNWHLKCRLDQVQATMAAAGLALESEMIEPGAYDPKTGYEATLRLLKRKPWPTALFAMNDVMAFGALEALRELGVRVPQEMAVVGFDDIRLAAFASPPLTTVREPDAEMGRQAAQLLLDQIEGRELVAREIRLETTLVIRESCGAKLNLSKHSF